MRIFGHAGFCVGDARHIDHLRRPLAQLAWGQVFLVVVFQIFNNLFAHRNCGVQRDKGVLENHRAFFAPESAPLFFGKFQYVPAVIEDLAALQNAPRALDQAHQRFGGHGFAAAAFAYQSGGLSPGQREGNIPHRMHFAGIGKIRHRKVFHFHQSVWFHVVFRASLFDDFGL